MAGGGERGGGAAGAHHPRVPQPFVDALTVQDDLTVLAEHDLFRKPVPTPDQVRGRLFGIMRLARLLVRLELRLQRGELGERRVRIGLLLVAPIAAARGPRGP